MERMGARKEKSMGWRVVAKRLGVECGERGRKRERERKKEGERACAGAGACACVSVPKVATTCLPHVPLLVLPAALMF